LPVILLQLQQLLLSRGAHLSLDALDHERACVRLQLEGKLLQELRLS
jgi:hypothetical protein